MGYFVILLICSVFIFFIVKKYLEIFSTKDEKMIGYYLLVDKYEIEGAYYGRFEQGSKVLNLELSVNLYVAVSVPSRGMVRVKQGKVLSFD